MPISVFTGRYKAELPLRRGARWQPDHPARPGKWRLAALLVAGSLFAAAAWAEPDAPAAELAAAMTVGPGHVAEQAPNSGLRWATESARNGDPRFAAEPAIAALAPPPRLSLSSSRAEPIYRFRGSVSNQLQSLSYRWWLGNGRAAVGIGLGTIGYVVPVPVEGDQTATTVVGSVPTASIGLRYALTPTTQAYADGSRAQGLAGEPDVLYNAKAGVEWKPAKSRLGFEGGRLGLQLDSGYRMSLRTRKGGVTIYLRRTF